MVIGIDVSTTGPAAALGVPGQNALDFVPRAISGLPLQLMVLDDGGDPTAAANNTRRFVIEANADVLIGGSTVPPTLAMAAVANEVGVLHLGQSPFIVTPKLAKWSVSLPQPARIAAQAIYDHMKANGVKTVGFIGYSDAFGDQWRNDLATFGAPMGLNVVDEQRFARPDTSVVGQVLRLIASNPDAVIVGASGTAAALPQLTLRERGYQGPIYHTNGTATDLIRIAGKAAEGAYVATGLTMAPESQPENSETRKLAVAFNGQYEGKYGPNTRNQFAANMYSAFLILQRIVPVALEKAKPGSSEFREALRRALLAERDFVTTEGVYNFTENDRNGLDPRSRVLVTVKNGKFEVVR
ncbi:branched-chain amino acid transport system substrate-binding protein [Bradyrhizobium macuxiense]|uniref:Branched-chain amino acid transport system substrate-binding protein n=1 Tax=Bradyrhizobium macuxiense TaxID=1755647 RepID=A0A560L3N1_9BRAD|nr:ABC transporter substrate-binding protein [Bradyrhizobium macuxiense]TWB87770.1 branched-chain amino acid transport system substrate-binding protein [Bradyrhizobium macuxiense]